MAWRSDDEPLFGEYGVLKLRVSVSFAVPHLSSGGLSLVPTVQLGGVGSTMVIF